ncbi:MAG: hypothetical protein J6P03_06365 [Opitutales bacterium]|nr:hypothetical protein [Opitutales bacterium]
MDALKDSLKNAERICSYWGHSNTEKAAQNILGVKFAKEDFRKPLRLSGNNMPMWGDLEFNKCYILSPNYKNGFRPEINKEVEPSEILSWKALLIEWE